MGLLKEGVRPRLPPSMDDDKYKGEVYTQWDGYLCRQDPLNAFLEDKKQNLISGSAANAIQRKLDIEELREKRQLLSERIHQASAPRTAN